MNTDIGTTIQDYAIKFPFKPYST